MRLIMTFQAVFVLMATNALDIEQLSMIIMEKCNILTLIMSGLIYYFARFGNFRMFSAN